MLTKTIVTNPNFSILPQSSPSFCRSLSLKFHSYPQPNRDHKGRKSLTLTLTLISSKSSNAELSAVDDEWLKKLPDRKKPLYSHSLPCIEAWLRKLGFRQSKDDLALWFIEKPEWHAQLSLDVTDLYIRYLMSGPGDIEKDVERRFSYALSREDIENAILGGP